LEPAARGAAIDKLYSAAAKIRVIVQTAKALLL
jgi:hypothetical protein